MAPNIAPLNKADISEQWHSFRLKAYRKLTAAVKAAKDAGLEQKDIAHRLDMDEGQLSGILSGRRTVTLRTMHDIARAIDHRLEIDVVPLQSLRQPNYRYTHTNDQSTAAAGSFGRLSSDATEAGSSSPIRIREPA